MSILGLLVMLIIVGVSLYCINKFVPMDQKIRNILNVVVVLIVLLWLLNAFGILSNLSDMNVPKLN